MELRNRRKSLLFSVGIVLLHTLPLICIFLGLILSILTGASAPGEGLYDKAYSVYAALLTVYPYLAVACGAAGCALDIYGIIKRFSKGAFALLLVLSVCNILIGVYTLCNNVSLAV